MDQRLARMLQVVSLAMMAWFAYSWLTKLHWLLAGSLFVFAVANAGVAWMLREHRAVLRLVVRHGLLRRYVNFVCSCTGDQLSLDVSANRSGCDILLRAKRDFEVAGERARQIVRGHDEVINRMLARVHENLTLRKRQRNGSRQGPLASFLLLGPDGVGKRYLSRVLAKLLYSEGPIDVFECDQVSTSQLTGGKGVAGELEPLRRVPHRIVLFEHVELAPPDLVRSFMKFLTSGKLLLSGSEQHVSLENTVVVFTATVATDGLSEAADPLCGAAIDGIASATGLDRQLLHAVTELMYCELPNDHVKSEVIALLLAKECGAHHIELDRVDPEIIATQVLQLEDLRGFASAPTLIKKLLRKPLVAAAEGDHHSLSLRVRAHQLTQ